MTFKTEQEAFWAGEFGDEYIGRNEVSNLLASNIHLFSKVFSRMQSPKSILEFGANIGSNLTAIKQLFPSMDLNAVEINVTAAKELSKFIGEDHVINESILEFQPSRKYDVSLIKGVLIHINPDELQTVYEKLYEASNKYIVICEYFNPSPVAVNYRGHENRLFKRDFAGEMLDKYADLALVDYGFCYKRDNLFPQDNITWFLLEKK